MKKNLLIDYLGLWAVNLLGFFARLLPRKSLLAFGKIIGWIAYGVQPRRRQIAYANLKAALGKEKTPPELARIVRLVFLNLGKNLVEMLRIPSLSAHGLKELVAVEGLYPLEEARRKGQGVVFLTAHFGNWELASLAMGVRGWKMGVLAREQRYSRLNQLLDSHRQRWGVRVLTKGSNLRDLVRILKRKETLGMLLDQDGGKNAPYVEFFGRPASTPDAVIALARRQQALIVPVFIVREKDGRHRLYLEPPLEMPETADQKETDRRYLQAFTRVLENYVRRFPEQWLWPHKRWKSTPVRKVIVLSDGKTGHLRQSQAVCRILTGVLAERGLHAETKTLTPEFKSTLRRTALSLGSFFSCRRCPGCTRCLRFSLTDSSYQEIIRTYADIIVSCGSSVAPVNLILSRENNARSVVIMKPNGLPLSRFDLVVAPRHDHVRPRSNVVITQGAPNLITVESMRAETEKLKTRITVTSQPGIGLLLGGDTSRFRLGAALAGKVIAGIMEAADTLDAQLFVTTSRRTSPEVEAVVKEKLKSYPRLRLLIIASEDSPEGAVSGILGLSGTVVVSGESISMVSEAVSSGKPVVVFPLEESRGPGMQMGKTKHGQMLADFSREGYLVVVSPEKLARTIVKMAGEKRPVRRLDDNAIIARGLEKLL